MKTHRNQSTAFAANLVGRSMISVMLRGQWLIKGLKRPSNEQEKKTE